jgi:hypothetical protein
VQVVPARDLGFYELDQAMEMVGHDYGCVQPDVRVMLGKVGPGPLHDPSCRAQDDPVVYHLAQEAFPVLNANRDEIQVHPAVILFPKPDRSAVLPVRIESHGAGF